MFNNLCRCDPSHQLTHFDSSLFPPPNNPPPRIANNDLLLPNPVEEYDTAEAIDKEPRMDTIDNFMMVCERRRVMEVKAGKIRGAVGSTLNVRLTDDAYFDSLNKIH